MSAFFAALAMFFSFPSPVNAAIEFSIANTQQESDYYKVDVSLSGLTSTSCLDGTCYLQAVLTASDQNKYFGYTWDGQSNWYEYISSPDPSFILSTFFSFTPDVEGSWFGNLLVKNNPSHSGYKGEGDYLVKVRRYSGKSKSHSGESDSLGIHLVEITPTEEPTFTSTPTPTEELTSTPTSTPTKKPTSIPTSAPTPTSTLTQDPSSAKVSPGVTDTGSSGVAETSSPEVLSAATESSIYKVFFQDSTTSSSPSTQSASAQSNVGVNLSLVGLGMVVLSASVLFFRHKT